MPTEQGFEGCIGVFKADREGLQALRAEASSTFSTILCPQHSAQWSAFVKAQPCHTLGAQDGASPASE